MRVDAHQHFCDPARFPSAWEPARAFLPPDLAPVLERNRFAGSVAIAATTTAGETRWLLDLASTFDFVRGVVGWADLTGLRLAETLDEFERHPKFKGLCHSVLEEPDENWLVREDVLTALRELASRGLAFDVQILPRHLRLLVFIERYAPGLRIAIGDMAHPPIEQQVFADWSRDIELAAAIPQVCCKLSRMAAPNAAHLRPYVRRLYDVFGPERLMFGSGWPACLQTGTWKQTLALLTQALGPLPIQKREQLLGETARRFYRLE